ncbi:hypothetical protein AB9F42_31990 [Rhizobium leguminosarum]|uniref:hypothetical protein n=1 Tax=Rhizobium leguminosarum TaxID=384 RepID=UPI003F9575DD
MITRSALFHLWKRQIFLRSRHEDFDDLLSMLSWTGIYMIGCANEVVYVGQTSSLHERPIQSLGNIYHRVDDTSLPWSIAFAPCLFEEMNERESTAIRAYGPRFNTSIPSLEKSRGRLPEIVATGAIFKDQNGPCGAFRPENLQLQIERALANPSPPWARKRTRAKSPPKEKRPTVSTAIPVEWTKEESDRLVKAYGVPIDGPLRFPINLCDEGSVVTKDGEFLGTWTMDEHEHPSFTPDGASEPLLFHVLVGLLCLNIRAWHEGAEEDNVIGPHQSGAKLI